VTIAQLGIEHLSLFGSTARGRAREKSDIDMFFDYKRQKGKVGLFDLVDVKEPSRSSSTMTRAFCQLSAAARLALPPVPPYERYRGIVHMTAAPDSPHRRAALMEAAGAAGLHKLTSRVFG
jgi:Polymerase beta, Nucleotidyltransferase